MRYLPLLLLLCLMSCDDDDQSTPVPMPEFEDGQFAYLALGDSYTIGTSVPEAEQWPRQLLNQLVDNRIVETRPADNILDIVAVNGWTTRNLIDGIGRSNNLGSNYDLVSLLIGVNNQFQGRSLPEYRAEFTQLLNEAITRAGGDRERVFVVSIPDYAYTPFGGQRQDITDGVNAFNEAARRITEDAGLPFYNITPISRDGLTDPGLVASDNLHPSGKQYDRWVREVIYPAVAELLEE